MAMKKGDPRAKESAKKSHLSGRMKKGQASRMGKNSRIFENEIASKLPYQEIFLPYEVCDRIAFVGGKVLFIEIKRKGQKLRPKQNRFRELVGKDYLVVSQ